MTRWPAALVLENGRVWQGEGFGARGESIGEVVFNTSITGYQEIVSDPSYAGQIVVMTATQIGNVGDQPRGPRGAARGVRRARGPRGLPGDRELAQRGLAGELAGALRRARASTASTPAR